MKNEGQAIWDEAEGYEFSLEGDLEGLEVSFSKIKGLEPFEEGVYFMTLTTSSKPVKGQYKIILKKGKEKILETQPWELTVLPLPPLYLEIFLFPKFKVRGDDFEVQIFDSRENLVFKKTHLKVVSGKARIERVQNIELGKRYRIVLLKPYYLPRQTFVVFKESGAKAVFKPLLPLDFDLDGNFDLRDFWFLIKRPENFKLFLPV